MKIYFSLNLEETGHDFELPIIELNIFIDSY